MQPVVDIRDLSYSYQGCEPALRNVSLRMNHGEFLAVIGPNGGGKTTLLRLMLGLLEARQGSIRLFGRPPSSASGNVGYVPQFSTLHLDFPATVLDMVLMGGAAPNLWGGGWARGTKARKQALAYLDVLGLADCAGQPVGGLSGGQRQRALVARALMSKPENTPQDACAPFLLLLDEPTASIDPQGKFCFYEFLGNLRGSITMVVVSHDLFMTSPFFSSIAFVNKTLTRLEGSQLSAENLTALFGQHLHDCPVADMQHAGGMHHSAGCSHPACAVADAHNQPFAAQAPGPSCEPTALHRSAPRAPGSHGLLPPSANAGTDSNQPDTRAVSAPGSPVQDGGTWKP